MATMTIKKVNKISPITDRKFSSDSLLDVCLLHDSVPGAPRKNSTAPS